MEWVNYHHLLYFWVVAREGGLVRAGKILQQCRISASKTIGGLTPRQRAELVQALRSPRG